MIKIKHICGISQLQNHGIQVFDPMTFDDNRGYLTVRAEDNMPENFPYVNYFSYKSTFSNQHVARGLHWQNDSAPIIKYIDLKKGSLFTVLVDMRTSEGVIFNWDSNTNKIIRVPQFHAHGFYCIEDSEFSYICKGKYSPADETTINVFPSVCRSLNLDSPLISEKDSKFPEVEVEII